MSRKKGKENGITIFAVSGGGGGGGGGGGRVNVASRFHLQFLRRMNTIAKHIFRTSKMSCLFFVSELSEFGSVSVIFLSLFAGIKTCTVFLNILYFMYTPIIFSCLSIQNEWRK